MELMLVFFVLFSFFRLEVKLLQLENKCQILCFITGVTTPNQLKYSK